jgi:DNA (cytosine-5)-methyltransferase 1
VRHPKTSPDLAWASFQYQDLSLADDRAGLDAARSGSFCPFWKLMQTLRAAGRVPRMIVLENVTGLFTSHGGKDFDAISNAIEECGYRAGAVVIDASLFVAQSRERVFVVAMDADAYTRPLSSPTDRARSSNRRHWPPPASASAIRCGGASQFRRSETRRLTTSSKMNRTACAGMTAQRASAARSNEPARQAKLEEAKAAGHKAAWTAFRRMRDIASQRTSRTELRFDGIAGCLRVPTGGSSRQFVVVTENGEVRSRLLSPREAARLMGLPDEYKLPANVNEALGLVGDGVAVPAVRYLAENLLEPLLLTFAL